MKLGDLIHYFTKYTGIKALVDWYSKYTDTDCGCDECRSKLNNIKGIRRWEGKIKTIGRHLERVKVQALLTKSIFLFAIFTLNALTIS
jgi:hypothetical protein